MPANWTAIFKFRRLQRNVEAGMEFEKAAKKAGYSATTIEKNGDNLKRRLGLLAPEKVLPSRGEKAGESGNPKTSSWEQPTPPASSLQFSPVSGRTWFASPEPLPKPEPPLPASVTFEERKQLEFRRVIEAKQRQIAAQPSFAMSYVTKYRKFGE